MWMKTKFTVFFITTVVVSVCIFAGATDSGTENVRASGVCGDDLVWSLKGGVMRIIGTGNMTDYPVYVLDPPWLNEKDSIISVIVEDGVTSIGENAFNECSNLKNVSFGESVQSIGYQAFASATSLMSVIIPDSVSYIGKSAFCFCTALRNVTFGSGLISIDSDAFGYCNSLTNVVFPDSVISIEKGAFQRCSNLTSVVIPDSVKLISTAAFRRCENLKSVVIGKGIEDIRYYAFADCDNLDSVTYKGSRNVSGVLVFDKCPLLSAVCVLHNSTASEFCELDFSRQTQDLLEEENKCFELVCENNKWTAQQRDSAREWESKSSACIRYSCDNESGFVSWSKCYSTDNMSLVCVNNECVENSKQEWIVAIEMDGLKAIDLDIPKVVSKVAELTGLKEDEFVCAVEVDEDGIVLRVSLYIDSEEKAKVISEAIGGKGCPLGVLCRAKTVDVQPNTFIETAGNCFNSMLLSLVMIISLMLSHAMFFVF